MDEVEARGPELASLAEVLEQVGREDRPEEEYIRLSQQHDELGQRYARLLDALQQRVGLARSWAQYQAVHQRTASRAREIQRRLEADDLTPEEAEALMRELQELCEGLDEWEAKKKELEGLVAGSDTTLKDRGSQRRLHFAAEMQALSGTLARTKTLLEQKQGRLDEISSQWQELERMEKELTSQLESTQTQLDTQTIGDSATVTSITELPEKVREIQQDLDSDYGPKLQEFQELARALMAADRTGAGRASRSQEAVETQWESVHEALGARFAACGKAAATWQEYTHARAAVTRALDHVTSHALPDDAPPPTTQQHVRTALDRCKVRATQTSQQARSRSPNQPNHLLST